MSPAGKVGRVIFNVLGVVELVVDVYGWVKRLVTKREQPFPLKPKPKASPAPRR